MAGTLARNAYKDMCIWAACGLLSARAGRRVAGAATARLGLCAGRGERLERGANRGPSITLALMHIDTLTPPEQRVLGCLIEKRFTTPDQYPLTLNALRLACNQSTNRDPVVDYDEETVRAAAQRLAQYGVARLASGHTSRATKYRHLAEEALGLGREQLAVLSVLLLRGPQTPGELKGRTERIVHWQSLAAVEQVLAELIERGYATRLERRPGQKEERFAQLLGGALSESESAAPARPAPTAAQMPSAAGADGLPRAGRTPGERRARWAGTGRPPECARSEGRAARGAARATDGRVALATSLELGG